MKDTRKTQGFTLIELMIVVAIIAIVAAFAIPSYAKYRERGIRSTAKAAMLEAAQMMQRQHTANNTYVGAPVGTNYNGENHTITVSATMTSFELTAVLTKVSSCSKLTLNNAGVRGAGSDAVKECWDK